MLEAVETKHAQWVEAQLLEEIAARVAGPDPVTIAEVIDEVRGTIRVLAHRPADRFDKVKKWLPFVADQGLTQEDTQPADVIAQRGIEVSDGIRGGDGHAEDASVRRPLGSSRGHDRPRLAHGQLLCEHQPDVIAISQGHWFWLIPGLDDVGGVGHHRALRRRVGSSDQPRV